MKSTPTPQRQSTTLQGGTLTSRSQQQRGGGMAAAPPPTPPYGYNGQPVPGSQTGGSAPRPPGPPTLLFEATTPKLLVPSRDALYALLVVPLLLWGAVVLAGMLHAEPIPEGIAKRDFEHPLTWFDRHVFRVWGPLLPLAPYLVRVAALGLRSGLRGGAQPQPQPQVRWRLVPGMTLPLPALRVYVLVIVGRIAVYLVHLALQGSSSLVLVSDHLILAASVVACFQSELVMCLSDIYKTEMLRGQDRTAGARQLAVVAALVSSMFALAFVYADMYCTARWYHHPGESLAAITIGAIAFQVPVVVWLLRCGSPSAGQGRAAVEASEAPRRA